MRFLPLVCVLLGFTAVPTSTSIASVTASLAAPCFSHFDVRSPALGASSSCDNKLGVVFDPRPASPQRWSEFSDRQSALVRTLQVPASGTPAQNGERLARVVKQAEADATPANPYLIQLDAGFYTLPGSGLTLPSSISLKGASMYSTIIYSSGIAFTFVDTKSPNGASFSLSDMWIQSPAGSIASPKVGLVVIDHVRAEYLTSLASTTNSGDVMISNSIVQTLTLADVSGATRFRILNSEVDTFTPSASTLVAGTVGCFGSYNVVLTPYSTTCN